MLQLVVESAIGLTGGDGTSVMLLSPDGRELVVVAAAGQRASAIMGARQAATASVAGEVLRRGTSSLIRGPATGADGLASAHPRDLGWGLSLPLRASRRLVGVLNVNTATAGEDLLPEQVSLLSIVANQAAIMIEVGRLYEDLGRKERRLELFVDRMLRTQDVRDAGDATSTTGVPAAAPGAIRGTASERPPSRSPGEPTADRLTARELEVLRLVVDGLTNKEIAARLSLSPDTVKSHVVHITQKLGVADRTQAAVTAVREGLVS